MVGLHNGLSAVSIENVSILFGGGTLGLTFQWDNIWRLNKALRSEMRAKHGCCVNLHGCSSSAPLRLHAEQSKYNTTRFLHIIVIIEKCCITTLNIQTSLIAVTAHIS